MHKINLRVLKRESLRGTEGEREEKGKELKRNVRKGRIKNQNFFFNRLGATEQEKRKIWGAMLCQQVAKKRKRKLKKSSWHQSMSLMTGGRSSNLN
jgi:hypothetical protein